MRRVAVIGPGRVGGALARGLAHIGDEVVAVAGTEASAGTEGPAGSGSASLQAFLDAIPTASARPLAEVAEGVDLVLVTTPDGAIPTVARAIAAADGVAEGQRWVHTSGGLGIDVLSPVAAAGGRVAACHPAMTFPDPEQGAANLRGASWAVTAAEPDLGWARVLVSDLGGSPVTLAEGDRTLYHAALAVGSNATTAVATMARDLLLGAGIEDPSGFLAPLVTTSALGGATRGVDALTGPIRRGDAGTVAAHLAELHTSFPEAVGAYRALGELILAHAVRAGLDAERVDAIRTVLYAPPH